MYTIGEFSRITGLSIKAIRLYHELELLVPCRVDQRTGYRSFDERAVERARVIVVLRQLLFSLDEIKATIVECGDELDLVHALERKRQEVDERLRGLGKVARTLRDLIREQRDAQAVIARRSPAIEEKVEAPVLVASIRWRGRYADTGKILGRIARSVGRHICGKPINLYYDAEFREDDADIESCLPIRRRLAADGVEVRTLAGGRCASLVHRGPYERLGESYRRMFAHLHQRGRASPPPSREVFLKGPGMILRGDPRNYLTEIQCFTPDDAIGEAS